MENKLIMTNGLSGSGSDSTQYFAAKKKYEYTLKNEYRKVIPQTVDSKIANSILASRSLFDKLGIDNLVIDINQSEDRAYPYKNENKIKNSPIATDYDVYVNAKSYEAEDKGFMVTRFHIKEDRGQVQTNGADVPIGNTFNAFLLNNNPATTAVIHNTTTRKLAHNIKETLDNIQLGDMPGVVRIEEGIGNYKRTGIIAPNVDNPSSTHLFHIEPKKGIAKDNIISQEEFTEGIICYIFAAKEFTMRNSLNAVDKDNDPLNRAKSAETVDLDSNDPCFKFFDKTSQIDGKPGMTEDELAQALDEIATKVGEPDKDGNQTLYFDKEKLNNFLAKQFPLENDNVAKKD